jgi:hypothetical protein
MVAVLDAHISMRAGRLTGGVDDGGGIIRSSSRSNSTAAVHASVGGSDLRPERQQQRRGGSSATREVHLVLLSLEWAHCAVQLPLSEAAMGVGAVVIAGSMAAAHTAAACALAPARAVLRWLW